MTTTPHLVKPGTQVNTTDGSTAQFDGEITPLQDGGYVVVWTDLSLTYNPQGSAIVGQRYDPPATKSAASRRMVARSISACSRTATSPGRRSRRWRTATSPWRTPICSSATATSRCIFSIRRCILSEPT